MVPHYPQGYVEKFLVRSVMVKPCPILTLTQVLIQQSSPKLSTIMLYYCYQIPPVKCCLWFSLNLAFSTLAKLSSRHLSKAHCSSNPGLDLGTMSNFSRSLMFSLDSKTVSFWQTSQVDLICSASF